MAGPPQLWFIGYRIFLEHKERGLRAEQWDGEYGDGLKQRSCKYFPGDWCCCWAHRTLGLPSVDISTAERIPAAGKGAQGQIGALSQCQQNVVIPFERTQAAQTFQSHLWIPLFPESPPSSTTESVEFCPHSCFQKSHLHFGTPGFNSISTKNIVWEGPRADIYHTPVDAAGRCATHLDVLNLIFRWGEPLLKFGCSATILPPRCSLHSLGIT